MGVVRRYSDIWRKEYGDKPVPWKLRISSPPLSDSENSIKLNSDIISQIEPDVKEKIGAIVSSMRNLIKTFKIRGDTPEWRSEIMKYIRKVQNGETGLVYFGPQLLSLISSKFDK